MTAPETLTATIRIEATPEEVYPYFVEPELLVQWIGSWADLSPQPGGVFALDVGGAAVRGSYVSLDPPHRVVFTWGIAGSTELPAGCSTVDIRLTAEGEQTLVELNHYGLPADQIPMHRTGWVECLERLAGAASGSSH